MIVTDKSKITQVCEPCKSVEEGEEIAKKLLDELIDSKSGIGLAANQIGINKRVCIVNVKEPVVLINPEIVEKSEEKFAFIEGCLSFPGESIKTTRHKWVKVKALNHEIDHLDGKTMYDRELILEPWKRKENKIGRNDKVLITKGTESKTIKYKKFDKMKEDGWVLVEV